MITLTTSSLSAAVVPERRPCLQTLEISFFQPAIVQQALSNYSIPQSIWDPLVQDLIRRSSTVPDRLKSKTAYMVPNPIEYPLQPEATALLLQQIWYEIFLESLFFYNVAQQPTARLMFEYIFERQFPALVACLGPTILRLAPKLAE
jgi:hypothetical protein